MSGSRPVRLQRLEIDAPGEARWETIATYATIAAASAAVAIRRDRDRAACRSPEAYRITAPTAMTLGSSDARAWDDLRSGRLASRRVVRVPDAHGAEVRA